MRPNTDLDIKTDDRLDGQAVRMTLDQDSLVHLMSVLTDLYSDPTLAVIREYATNALDAHAAAGNDDPIRVTLPSELNPTYVVADQGIGMTPDELVDIFSKYGASTKRETDAEVGMLGLGAKAALTYASQFTLVSVKGGTKATVVVSRGEDGAGTLTIADVTDTDEPNGVTVRVPVSDVDTFNRKARRFFSFWREGVLVNGEAPETPEGVWVDPDILVTTDLDADHVVMGNVPYKVDYEHSVARWGVNVVTWVPMGAVNFAPNRETLQYTERTEHLLDRLKSFVPQRAEQLCQDEVEKAPSIAEALDVYLRWRSSVESSWLRGVTYRGDRLPLQVGLPSNAKVLNLRGLSAESKDYINVDDARKFVHIPDYPNKTLSKTNRRKVAKYLEDREVSRVLLYDASDWVKRDLFARMDNESWGEIEDVEVERAASGGGSRASAGTYDVLADGGVLRSVPEDEVPDERDIVFYSPAKDLNASWVYRQVDGDATVVVLGKGRWDKFQRLYPKATHIGEWALDRYESDASDLTLKDRWALAGKPRTGRWADVMRPRRVDDPQLRLVLRGLNRKRSTERTERMSRMHSLARRFGKYPDVELDLPDWEALVNRVSSRYPLLDGVGYGANADDLEQYVNALVATRRE